MIRNALVIGLVKRNMKKGLEGKDDHGRRFHHLFLNIKPPIYIGGYFYQSTDIQISIVPDIVWKSVDVLLTLH